MMDILYIFFFLFHHWRNPDGFLHLTHYLCHTFNVISCPEVSSRSSEQETFLGKGPATYLLESLQQLDLNAVT
jgi:hypothetical protein